MKKTLKQNMPDYYKNSDEYLFDELLQIDLLIQAQVIKFRSQNKEPKTNLKGLYISESEIDELLKKNIIDNSWTNQSEEIGEDFDKISESVKKLGDQIKIKLAGSIKKGIDLKLIKLASLYKLDSFETDILIVCLASQFDNKYRKLFAYLQNDVTLKNPTVELVLNLFCMNFKERLNARVHFSSHSPLFKNNIIQFIEDPKEPDKPLIARELTANTRMVNYILGHEFIDENISLISEVNKSNIKLDNVVLPEDIRDKIDNFVTYFRNNLINENFIFSFYGAYGSQKLETACAICNNLGFQLLIVDLLALNNSDLYFERALDLVLRESKIMPSAIYFKNSDFLFDNYMEESYIRRYFLLELDKNSNLMFIESSLMLPIQGEFSNQRVISIELPIPEFPIRKELWIKNLRNYQLEESADINEIASKYNLTAGQIKDIMTTASTFAIWRDSKKIIITQKDIEEACHIHSNQKLNQLAQRIHPKHVWNDIILPADIKEKLRELVQMFKYKYVVYNDWGFDKKLSIGKGISALFYGEPGTGKTLACEIIARELGMDLYKIDISTIVSKYIGETEKNLSRIFKEAECSNAIIFFDEADAIFGKRTEVKDSHDRYSNIEVSYLLQKIDEYTGVVILSTNFMKNIDPAFLRRLQFNIGFPFPEEEYRKVIWQLMYPEKTPLDKNIDYGFLANKLKITGGNIKNIALQSAFFAAEKKETISMNHIFQAAKREYQKLGKDWEYADIKKEYEKFKKTQN
jgi:ATP-dependent 26S proteasome regulatory subunit